MVGRAFAFEPENAAGQPVAGNILRDDRVYFRELAGMEAVCGDGGRRCGMRGTPLGGILREDEERAGKEDSARDGKQNSCGSHFRVIVRREQTLLQG